MWKQVEVKIMNGFKDNKKTEESISDIKINYTEEKNKTNKDDDKIYVSKFNNSLIQIADGKRNIRTSKRRYFIYKILKKANLSNKLYRRYPWLETIDYDVNSKLRDEILNEKIDYNRIIVYDLVPKEYLENLKEDIFRFKKEEIRTIFSNNAVNIDKQFAKMLDRNTKNSYFNIANIRINEKSKLKKYIDQVIIQVTGFTDSFCIVVFDLRIGSQGKDLLLKILRSKVYRPLLFKVNKNNPKRSLADASNYRYIAKEKAIRDFELEVLFIFFKQFTHSGFYYFNRMKKINPYLSVYAVDDLENLGKVKNLFGIQNIPKSKTNSIESFIKNEIFTFNRTDELNKTTVFLNKSDLEYTSGRSQMHYYLEQLIMLNSHYAVINQMSKVANNKIYSAQRSIDSLTFNKRFSPVKMLKRKNKIYNDTIIHSRITKELMDFNYDVFIEQVSTFYGDSVNTKETEFLLRKQYMILKNENESRLKTINQLFDYFDDKLSVVVNNSSIKWAFWSLVIAFLSLVTTVIIFALTTEGSNIIEEIIDQLKVFLIG